MNSNFPVCLAFVLEDEGGNTDDPTDPGGRTSRGITQRVFNAWCNAHGEPLSDVWTASNATVAQIYSQKYWLPECDPLPKGEDYLLFDMKVNMGARQAIILLQRALGVAADGIFGPLTLTAAMDANIAALLPAVTAQKIAFYKELIVEYPTDSKYYQGWLNRVQKVQARIPAVELRALKMMRT
jgi:lysozyme family protein